MYWILSSYSTKNSVFLLKIQGKYGISNIFDEYWVHYWTAGTLHFVLWRNIEHSLYCDIIIQHIYQSSNKGHGCVANWKSQQEFFY